MRQAKAYRSNHRHEMQLQHAIGRRAIVGRHDNQQFVFTGVGLADVVDDGNVVGLRRFQIVSTLVTGLQQQGCGFAIDERKNAVVHILNIAGDGPVEALLKSVERP